MKKTTSIIDYIVSLSIIIVFIFSWENFKKILSIKEQTRKIYFYITNDSKDAIINKEYLEKQYSNLFFKEDFSMLDILKKIRENSYVKTANCIKNIIGDIIIEVFLKTPAARIKLSDNIYMYVEKDGTLFPNSIYNSYRLPIIEISEKNLKNIKNINNIKYGDTFLKFFNQIMQHPFFSKNITYIKLNDNGKIQLKTQFAAVNFEFGQIEEIEEKIKKMEVFYKKIIPFKGPNAYNRVNLEFKNQIICE